MFVPLLILAISLSSIQCQNDILLEKTFVSLHKVLNFIYISEEAVNVDELFSIVLASGHLRKTIEGSIKDKKWEPSLFSLFNLTQHILHKYKPLLPEPELKYYIFNKFLLDEDKWYNDINFTSDQLRPKKPKEVDSSILRNRQKYWDYLQTMTFNEDSSDECIVELILSRHQDEKCLISQRCYKMMVNDERLDPMYGTTHRLLYIQIAERIGCKWKNVIVKNKIKQFCGYMYWEYLFNKIYGFLHSLDDLMLEQVTLCGMEGFTEFINDELLSLIISYQTQEGCFGVPYKRRRNKRESNYYNGSGCNDHSTGLGASSLALYLRYFFNEM